ncbi:unnamed protein product [Symbiodinium pilosum]|uniref:LamG-like jellyroll fold domain-containing protein n=1 Tax=Symbiodinium pilosum TaxID=2952 RepID=A0A812MU23_SYMPI|nr:unnamed protein product [Symbiodinium pilosum]
MTTANAANAPGSHAAAAAAAPIGEGLVGLSAVPKASVEFTTIRDDEVDSSAVPKASIVTDMKKKEKKEAPKTAAMRNLGLNELRLPTVEEEVIDEFHPAVCAGQSLQAAITLAGLSIKVGAAMRECNQWFYRPPYADIKNLTTGKTVQIDEGVPAIRNGRRLKLKDAERITFFWAPKQLIKEGVFAEAFEQATSIARLEQGDVAAAAQVRAVRHPGPPNALVSDLPSSFEAELQELEVDSRLAIVDSSLASAESDDASANMHRKTHETAYNITEFDLSLDNMSFRLGDEWTLEGWHYFLANAGVIWDTRTRLGNTTMSGLAVVLSNNGSIALMVQPRGGAPFAYSCPNPVPLKTWVHVACQRRGSFLDFVLNGTQVCTMPTPAELDNLEPQTMVRIGRAATNDTDSSLHALISNMRLSTKAFYDKSTSEPPRHLDLHPKTQFLLHGGYLEQVSMRPLLISGHGLMEGVVNHGGPTRKLKHPPMRGLQLNVFPDQDRALPGGLPEKWGPQAGRRSAYCARTVLTIIKDAGTIASAIETNLAVCAEAKLVGQECAKGATRSIRAASNAAKYLAELPVRGCNQQWFRGYYKCGERLEGASWEFDALGTELGETVEACNDLDLDLRHIRRKDSPIQTDYNWGACAGEVASSAGYASTAGMYLGTAVGFDCPSALGLDKKKAAQDAALEPPYAFPRGYTPAEEARDLCAQESLGFVRTLFLSGTKAARAGGSCSNTGTVCSQNILLAMAAFAGIGQVGAIVHDKCLPLRRCCAYDRNEEDFAS